MLCGVEQQLPACSIHSELVYFSLAGLSGVALPVCVRSVCSACCAARVVRAVGRGGAIVVTLAGGAGSCTTSVAATRPHAHTHSLANTHTHTRTRSLTHTAPLEYSPVH